MTRKRFVKLMMSKGVQRNEANAFAKIILIAARKNVLVANELHIRNDRAYDGHGLDLVCPTRTDDEDV